MSFDKENNKANAKGCLGLSALVIGVIVFGMLWKSSSEYKPSHKTSNTTIYHYNITQSHTDSYDKLKVDVLIDSVSKDSIVGIAKNIYETNPPHWRVMIWFHKKRQPKEYWSYVEYKHDTLAEVTYNKHYGL